MKKDTTKKTVVKKVSKKELSLEQHYENFFNSTTVEEKTKNHNIINNLLKK